MATIVAPPSIFVNWHFLQFIRTRNISISGFEYVPQTRISEIICIEIKVISLYFPIPANRLFHAIRSVYELFQIMYPRRLGLRSSNDVILFDDELNVAQVVVKNIQANVNALEYGGWNDETFLTSTQSAVHKKLLPH